jgi:hypothetical protein
MTARREKRATLKVYGARGLKRCWEFLAYKLERHYGVWMVKLIR